MFSRKLTEGKSSEYMTRMHTEITYQAILKSKLEERCKANSRYSLRAFARDLGMNPSHLSEILNHKTGLSEQTALSISKKLNLSETEAEIFYKLVVASDARKKENRAKAIKDLNEHYSQYNLAYLTLENDTFKLISDWYHLALIDLVKTHAFKSDKKWISKRLGISIFEVEGAINRLIKLGFLEKRGDKLLATEKTLATTTDIPSEAIRKFHSQILEKASSALVTQNIDDRDFSALTIPVDTKDLPELKKKIREFRKYINSLTQKSKNKNEVYCLSVQFFRLSEKEMEL